MSDRKLCAACAHLAAYCPMMCRRFPDPLTNRPRLAQPLRDRTVRVARTVRNSNLPPLPSPTSSACLFRTG
jgi:hypothetical protein